MKTFKSSPIREEQHDAALQNSRAYFDDWTTARPASEWPPRQASPSATGAEVNRREVGVPVVPPPAPPAETQSERGEVVQMSVVPGDVLSGPAHVEPAEEPRRERRSESEPDCRRRDKRVDGPFDGLRVGALETPVQLYDLSRGGCFINSMHQQRPGVKMRLKIDLPYEGWITVDAEALYRRGEFGFAVRFIDLSAEASERLERALDAWSQVRSTGTHPGLSDEGGIHSGV